VTDASAFFEEALSPALDHCRHLIASRSARTARTWAKQNIFGAAEPVTATDIEIQDVLTRACARAFPSVPVIGEEGPACGKTIPGTCFLIDPIDGTGPFLRGERTYTISVCLAEDGRPRHALVDLPGYGLRVWAHAGEGVLVQGAPAVLPAFGAGTLLASPGQARVVAAAARDAPQTRPLTVRAVPTTSMKMILVALHHASAAVRCQQPRTGAAPWDYAAAALILAESGAIARGTGNRDLSSSLPVAARGWLACRDTRLLAPLLAIASSACASSP
jgi:fructose-1,6-bisphosphatase/inositol monophosphatase family enzyme